VVALANLRQGKPQSFFIFSCRYLAAHESAQTTASFFARVALGAQVAHPSSDFSQSPSLNDQRRIATTELAIGVKPAELSAPKPDAAPQPTPVNQITLVPCAKSFELMRQLEALANEVALVSRGHSSNQGIEVQEGSKLSAGPQRVELSIRVSPRDHLASDSRSFGGRTNLILVGFFTAIRDWLASYRPSVGRLADFFTATRDRLASHRPSFGRSSAALTNLFIAARDWLASHRSSFGGRRSAILASFFIAALIGVAATFVWQSQPVSTAKSPTDVAVAEKLSGVTPVGQVPLQNSPSQPAPVTQTAAAPTAPAAAAQEQLAAKQEQIDQNIAKPQAVKRDIKHARETVRLNGYSAGTIVIKTNERHLYYVTGEGQAIRYRVGVGKAGMAWTGTSSIDGKYIRPAWQAPESIRKDHSTAAPVIPGGSPSNPMGAAAMTLSGGGQYAIHGTNNPGSIGGFVSHGCIRMYNQDIMDLYARASVGTKVVVLR
jgi:lipoprotein-anchoring transpeptidase ErfK/SrfK